MKLYSILTFSLLIISSTTKATNLNDFYTWDDRQFSTSPNFKFSNKRSGSGRKLFKLISSQQGVVHTKITFQTVKDKTCHVEISDVKNKEFQHLIGKEGYIFCARANYGDNYNYSEFSSHLVGNYDSILQDIFDEAHENKNLKILRRLSGEFSNNSIASKAKYAINEFNESVELQKSNIRNEFNKAKSIAQKTSIFGKIQQGKTYEKGGVKYKDVITKPQIEKMIEEVYREVSTKNNIAGYNWFIKEYAISPLAKKALVKLHKLAFDLASDIGTINSYNDFIIAYPLAKQANEVSKKVFNMELNKYTGFFSNEEKEARRLLIQSKMLEQDSEDLSREQRVGYMMVVNRMNDLLKQEFNSTDAALRHLESNEFKSFVRSFKRAMKDLKSQVARIADNTQNLSRIMKDQSSMMNNHFESAAQDREMATEMTNQHRVWERYIGKVGY